MKKDKLLDHPGSDRTRARSRKPAETTEENHHDIPMLHD
jgi:hypothetical protein